MVDAFEFDGHYVECITFKDVWWEDHHGLETQKLALLVWYLSLTPYFVYMLSLIDFSMFWIFMFIMFKYNVYETCDIHMQYLRYTYVYMDYYFFVFSLQFSHCVYPTSKARAFILMIMFAYDFALHVLITCFDEIFIKTCDYTCTTNESHLFIMCLYFIAHLYPLDILV